MLKKNKEIYNENIFYDDEEGIIIFTIKNYHDFTKYVYHIIILTRMK